MKSRRNGRLNAWATTTTVVVSGCVLAALLFSRAPFAQTIAWDGVWRGRAEGGTCAPLDIHIIVEAGLLDGTASEPEGVTQPQQGRRVEKPPVPALWQLNGTVSADGTVAILGLRAVRERERQRSRWSGRASGETLRIVETDGPCRRSATLSRRR